MPKILTLVEYENKMLHQRTKEVIFPLSEQDKELISNMRHSIKPEQLKAADAPWNGAVGMAANQWGFDKRIFLFAPTGENFEVIINPKYTPLSEEQDYMWESCFSIPLAVGNICRFKNIEVEYDDELGEHRTRKLSDWDARVWQHENDHLDGILYDDNSSRKCIEKKVFSSREEVDAFFEEKRSNG